MAGTPLRTSSARPLFLVDARSSSVGLDTDPAVIVGMPGPWGRQRIVSAMMMNEPPRWIVPSLALKSRSDFIGLPDGTLIGANGLWCNRILSATIAGDTRRL